jgi:hypothetical protein
MISKNSFQSRRHFLNSLVGVTVSLPALFSKTLSGQTGEDRRLLTAFPKSFEGGGSQAHPAEGALEFDSSNTTLVRGFQWAKGQALAYVRNGDAVGPWYEASLPGRNAFCMRDVSHMSTGAQFLGLGARTKNMLRRFAEHISASKQWCTWWEITREDKPAPVDYNNDHDFWYDLPASFDVLDTCYRQWLWTRDDAYLDDVFLNYYRHTVTDYVEQWDHNKDGLLEHLPQYGHRGIATYDEDLVNDVLVGADLIAAQYAAYCRYAAIQHVRNQEAVAQQFTGKADALKALYNRDWWDASRNSYYAALGEDGTFHKDLKASTGRGDIEFPLYFGLTESGPKTQASLDVLQKCLQLDEAAIDGVIGGVEGRSYLPDIFYKYDRSRSGYTALVAMMNPTLKRREYPEVSYTVIGNLGTGLMGIRPSPNSETIETYPQLTSDSAWAAMHHVPAGNNVISVRHTENRETTLSNETGAAIAWRVSFPGNASSIFIDGRKVSAENVIRMGGTVEACHVLQVGPGETRVASLGVT